MENPPGYYYLENFPTPSTIPTSPPSISDQKVCNQNIEANNVLNKCTVTWNSNNWVYASELMYITAWLHLCHHLSKCIPLHELMYNVTLVDVYMTWAVIPWHELNVPQHELLVVYIMPELKYIITWVSLQRHLTI